MHMRALALLLIVPSGVAVAEGVKPRGAPLKADTGYYSDAFAFDGPAGRLAVVKTDGSNVAELQVVDVDHENKVLMKADLSQITTTPREVRFVMDGQHLFVVGSILDTSYQAWLLDWNGKVVRSWGPAQQIGFVDGATDPLVSVFNSASDKGGTVYEVSVFSIATGAARGKAKLTAAADGQVTSPALDLSVLYWKNGYTQLVGRKKGGYDKKRDARMPDSEGTYDVTKGAVIKDTPIADVIGWTKLMRVRAQPQYQNHAAFVSVTEDLKNVELFTADDKRVKLPVTEPMPHYDTNSLLYEEGRDGKMYFSLTIDPYNADAVDRKSHDAELIDLYAADASGKVTRLARIDRKGRAFVWHVVGGRLALLRKNKAVEGGGPELELYDLAP
jgi:hypothetical protein